MNTPFLQQVDRLIGEFEEHLRLAHSLTDDDKMKVFLQHLLDEESEHREALARWIANPPEASDKRPTVPLASDETADDYRHVQRRDQNVLTVGSLFGKPQ
jgi:hypothetical protein